MMMMQVGILVTDFVRTPLLTILTTSSGKKRNVKSLYLGKVAAQSIADEDEWGCVDAKRNVARLQAVRRLVCCKEMLYAWRFVW